MQFRFKSLIEFFMVFNSEEKCVTYLEQQRWGDKPVCPHCNHDKVYRTNRGFKCGSSACYKKFTVTVGTYFQGSKIKLQKWFAAMYLTTAHKKGISGCQLSRDINVSQKTAWFMLHRIRAVMKEQAPAKLKGEVEIDESYIGGKTKNMHAYKRAMVYGAGTGAVHMNPILGMIERGGIVRLIPVPEPNGATIKPHIYEHVEVNSSVMTDGHGGYYGLHKDYQHEIVRHDQGEYVNGNTHTNTIECVWSHLKRTITGVYHSVSGKHLLRYCDEFTFRYNNRDLPDCERFNLIFDNIAGRLTYKQLVYG